MYANQRKIRFTRVEMRKKRVLAIWLSILGVVLVSGLVLAACGESSGTTGTTTDAPWQQRGGPRL